jgi:hypothetical protein
VILFTKPVPMRRDLAGDSNASPVQVAKGAVTAPPEVSVQLGGLTVSGSDAGVTGLLALLYGEGPQ